MKNLLLAGSLGLMLVGLTAPHAQASPYTVTLTQQGSNVVANGSGAIDTTGLGSFTYTSHTSHVDPSASFISMGASPTLWAYTIPSLVSQPFGTGGFTAAASSSGSDVGINVSNTNYYYPDVYVPANYVSDTNLTNSATWNGSFASLGLMPGTYVWTWGTGADRSFTVDVQASAPTVADPPTLALLGAGVLGWGLVFLRRRKAA